MKVETEATKVNPKTFQTNYVYTQKTSCILCAQSVCYITLCADKIRESWSANREISLPVHQIVVKHIHSSISITKKASKLNFGKQITSQPAFFTSNTDKLDHASCNIDNRINNNNDQQSEKLEAATTTI